MDIADARTIKRGPRDTVLYLCLITLLETDHMSLMAAWEPQLSERVKGCDGDKTNLSKTYKRR